MNETAVLRVSCLLLLAPLRAVSVDAQVPADSLSILDPTPIPAYRQFPDCQEISDPDVACRLATGPSLERLRSALKNDVAAVWVEGVDRLTVAYEAPPGTRSVGIEGGVQLPMSVVEGTNYWVLPLRLPEADRARIRLGFVRETDDGPIRDTTSLREYRAPLAPPRPPRADRISGTLRTDSIRSRHLDAWRRVTWYLPPGEGSGAPLPVVYVADGSNVGSWAAIIDTLIRAREIPGVALVGVWAARPEGPIRSLADDTRAVEYLEGVAAVAGPDSAAVEARNRQHLRFFTEEVPRWAESELGVSDRPADRAVQGASNAGAFALRLGRDLGDRYGAVIAFSHSGLRDGASADAPGQRPIHFLAVGRLEQARLYEGLAALADELRERSVPVRLERYPGGHDWLVWSELFPEAIRWWLVDRKR